MEEFANNKNVAKNW